MAILGGIGLAWVMLYHKSSETLMVKEKVDTMSYKPPTIEEPIHYGYSSEIMNRFNQKLSTVSSHIGQFGLKYDLRYDTDGSLTRVVDAPLEYF